MKWIQAVWFAVQYQDLAVYRLKTFAGKSNNIAMQSYRNMEKLPAKYNTRIKWQQIFLNM